MGVSMTSSIPRNFRPVQGSEPRDSWPRIQQQKQGERVYKAYSNPQQVQLPSQERSRRQQQPENFSQRPFRPVEKGQRQQQRPRSHERHRFQTKPRFEERPVFEERQRFEARPQFEERPRFEERPLRPVERVAEKPRTEERPRFEQRPLRPVEQRPRLEENLVERPRQVEERPRLEEIRKEERLKKEEVKRNFRPVAVVPENNEVEEVPRLTTPIKPVQKEVRTYSRPAQRREDQLEGQASSRYNAVDAEIGAASAVARSDFRIPAEQRDLESAVHAGAAAYNGDVAAPQRLSFQIHGQDGPHSYRYGYDTGVGYNRQFKYEERDNYGVLHGRYGYYDQEGKLQIVNYSADPQKGFHAEGDHVPKPGY